MNESAVGVLLNQIQEMGRLAGVPLEVRTDWNTSGRVCIIFPLEEGFKIVINTAPFEEKYFKREEQAAILNRYLTEHIRLLLDVRMRNPETFMEEGAFLQRIVEIEEKSGFPVFFPSVFRNGFQGKQSENRYLPGEVFCLCRTYEKLQGNTSSKKIDSENAVTGNKALENTVLENVVPKNTDSGNASAGIKDPDILKMLHLIGENQMIASYDKKHYYNSGIYYVKRIRQLLENNPELTTKYEVLRTVGETMQQSLAPMDLLRRGYESESPFLRKFALQLLLYGEKPAFAGIAKPDEREMILQEALRYSKEIAEYLEHSENGALSGFTRNTYAVECMLKWLNALMMELNYIPDGTNHPIFV